MRKTLIPAALTGLLSVPAAAADVNLQVTIPSKTVSEYHRPYVAIWIERADQTVAANAAVWYEVKKKDGGTWLKDLRQWWRKSGRDLSMPVDGVTGATKAPGTHTVNLSAAAQKLAPGSYSVVVEAAREVGGRELVRVPLQWPVRTAQNQSVQGKDELGAVALNVRP